MHYMILRRADRHSESGAAQAPDVSQALSAFSQEMADAGVLRACHALQASSQGARLSLAPGRSSVVDGPFTETKELIAGFAVIEVASREQALDWARRWPAQDGGGSFELEVRETGCPGGCARVSPADAAAGGQLFAILLRSSPDLEAEVEVPQHKLDELDAFNAGQARLGVLIDADGLRSSARGARLHRAGGKVAVVDGPFTEIKEMIAGYWLIRVASLQQALDWARSNPYPTGPEVEVEIRQLVEANAAEQFTPELRDAEQRIRAQQLESGLHAQLAAPAPAWR